MKTRNLFLASLVVAAGLVAFAFLTAARLPEDALLPTHWNAAGEADAFSPALHALLLPPAILAGLAGLFAIIPRIEPMQHKLQGSAPVLAASWIGMILLMIAISMVIGLPAWGIALSANFILLGAGLLLVIIGNALPKSRPGFFVGIRTPWAIMDTDNWIATHRLGGKLFMAAGVAIILAAMFALPGEMITFVVLAGTLLAAGLPYLYSWWLWRNNKEMDS